MLIPGGHKSNVMWDDVPEMQPADRHSMDGVPGAIEIHMSAGDVLLFVDCLTHGSARRINPGVRRTIWYRYTMAWSRMRFGYHPSAELCERLERSASPRRAAIVDPHWGRRLEGGPQAEAGREFGGSGGAWSERFFAGEDPEPDEPSSGVPRAADAAAASASGGNGSNRAVVPSTTADPAATASDGVARYVPAIEVLAGSRTLHVSGQVGIDVDGKLADGLEAQLAQAYANVELVLAEAGMGWEDAVKATILLTDEAQIAAWRAARDRAMGGHKCAATLQVVKALAAPGMLVEIELAAAKAT